MRKIVCVFVLIFAVMIFTVTTTHTVSCPIPGSDYVTGTLGPFKNVSNFTINAIG